MEAIDRVTAARCRFSRHPLAGLAERYHSVHFTVSNHLSIAFIVAGSASPSKTM